MLLIQEYPAVSRIMAALYATLGIVDDLPAVRQQAGLPSAGRRPSDLIASLIAS